MHRTNAPVTDLADPNKNLPALCRPLVAYTKAMLLLYARRGTRTLETTHSTVSLILPAQEASDIICPILPNLSRFGHGEVHCGTEGPADRCMHTSPSRHLTLSSSSGRRGTRQESCRTYRRLTRALVIDNGSQRPKFLGRYVRLVEVLSSGVLRVNPALPRKHLSITAKVSPC